MRNAFGSENPFWGCLGLHKHEMKSHHHNINIKCQKHVTNLVQKYCIDHSCHYSARTADLVLCSKFFSPSLVFHFPAVRNIYIQIVTLYFLGCYLRVSLFKRYSLFLYEQLPLLMYGEKKKEKKRLL